MILTCEKCATSYSVADDALGTDGRKVKCISCGHVWLQAANDDSKPSDEAGRLAQRAASDAPPKGRGTFMRRLGSAAAVAALLLAVGGIAGYIYVGRAMIVQSWPPAALLYDEFGIGLHDLNLAAIPGGRRRAGISQRHVGDQDRRVRRHALDTRRSSQCLGNSRGRCRRCGPAWRIRRVRPWKAGRSHLRWTRSSRATRRPSRPVAGQCRISVPRSCWASMGRGRMPRPLNQN